MKLMIVDDNRQVREGIRYGIEWDKYGFTEVTDYADGAQAARKLTAEKPDIIIADIRMPDMDGLELLEVVRKNLDNCRYILLSAYSEFEYAQKAIRLGADDYILKPVKPDKLIDIVMKNARELSSRIEEQDVYFGIYEKSFLHLLSKGEAIGNEDKLKQLLAYKYGYDITGNLSFLVLVQIERSNGKMLKKPLKEKTITQIKERLMDKGAVFVIQENRLALICQGDSSQMRNLNFQYEIKKAIGEVNEVLLQEGLALTAGISDSLGLKELHTAYQHANDALDRTYYGKSGECILYITGEQSQKAEFPEERQKYYQNRIVDAYLRREQKELHEIFSELSKLAEKERYRKSGMAAFFRHCYLSLLQRGGMESGPEFEKSVIEDAAHFEKSIQEFEEYLKWSLNGERSSGNAEEFSLLIRNICDYMEEHYGEPISVESIGSVFGRTPNYISAKFKKEVGKSFADYLISLRVQKAVSMLRYTSIPIHEIAAKTGFGSYAYFSRTFHRCTGKSAGAIRKEKQS